MALQSFAKMSEQEFQSAIDGYIDRAATGDADVPANVFFDLLAERIMDDADKTINLSVDIVNNGIEIHPDQATHDIVIRGNEIWVGKHRLILHLAMLKNSYLHPSLSEQRESLQRS